MRSRLLLIVPPVCLCVLLLAGDATPGQAPPLRETFRRVQRSVVVVRTVKETVALTPAQCSEVASCFVYGRTTGRVDYHDEPGPLESPRRR